MEEEDPLLGKQIDDKYSVEKILGHGGMGVVYRAKHQLMHRTVAIKMLRKDMMERFVRGDYVERFQREAETQARFEHPHAVTIHDYGVYDGSPYLVMQYVEGRTLKQVLEEDFDKNRSRLLPLVVQVCEALHEAHQVGVIHRDLKPENIMISDLRDGEEKAVLLDFGIAKLLEPSEVSVEETQAGQVMGTPHYMSPEQAKGKNLDARSDLYSMGVILYEVCTGQKLFEGQTAMSIILMHLSKEPPLPREAAPEKEIPAELEKVILKALEKDPDNRQQDLKEFISELKDSVADELGYQVFSPPPAVSKRVIALSIALLCACALLLYLWRPVPKTVFQTKTVVERVVETVVEPADWAVIKSGLDDAVEKMKNISDLAVKAAQFNRKLSLEERPSKKERWERLKEKAIEEYKTAVDGYLREVDALVGLTSAQSLVSDTSRYLKDSLSSGSVIPNRLNIVKQVTVHAASIEAKNRPSVEQIIADAISAVSPESLETYAGDFDDFCPSCE